MDENACRLLRAIRAYVELDILASFDVHTEKTIKHGRSTAKKFVRLANVSYSALGGSTYF